MLRARSLTTAAVRLLACAALLMVPAAHVSAVAIDLSLNVLYTNPQNAAGGGTWQLVAKSDGFGIAAVRALLTGIDFASAANAAPRGTVNGSDPAGFQFVKFVNSSSGFTELNLFQSPVDQPVGAGEEQSVFYGVGTLTNGAPNYPGKPAGTNSIGPAFTSLTSVMGVPWAATNTFNQPAWVTAATLASGTFAPGLTPGFFSNTSDSSGGNTFLNVGTSTVPGAISDPRITATTIVRTNLVQTADYNHNGIVDAADYVVWRNTFGSTTQLAADGNSNGVIDDGDYTVWRTNFGTVFGSGAGSVVGTASGATGFASAVVPEPTSLALLAISAAFSLTHRRRRSPLSDSQKSAPGQAASTNGNE